MAIRTLPNIRQASDVTVKVKLKDDQTYVDWTGLEQISAKMFSDVQKVISGDFSVSVDSDDHTVLVCAYSADQYEHLGVNRIVVLAVYDGDQKAYDTPFANFVPTTDDVAGTPVTVDDPVVEVEIVVDDVDTSLLNNAIAAAMNAAAAATAAITNVPYVNEATGNWMVWDANEGEYVDSGMPSRGESVYQLAVDAGYEGTEAQFIQAYWDAIQLANTKAGLANAAAGAANDAATLANTKAGLANDAATLANTKAGLANDAATLANTKAGLADTAAAAATSAAAAATSAASDANNAADAANEAAAAATDAANSVGDAIEAAETATSAAEAATSAAEAATEAANDAAEEAETQGDYAKEQGDYAKQEVDGAKGDFDSLNERFEATENAAIEVDETTDPSSAEYLDEYRRVLSVLYQAITDARYALSGMSDAMAVSAQATGEANNAAAGAVRAAAQATAAAQEAMGAAMDAVNAMDAAKGNYDSLDERLHAIEIGKQDVIADLETIRDNALAGSTAYQLPSSGIPKENLSSDVQDTLDAVDLIFEPSNDPSDLA